MQFTDLQLSDPLLKAVREKGYDTPTPVQEQAIPPVLAGRDLIGCAQTGTGKTAAFALPILERMLSARSQRPSEKRAIRVLVLTPTRELASQIDDEFRSFSRYTPFRSTVIFGGVGQANQISALRNGVDILIATPGRLLDLMNQGFVRLDRLEVFVLDEADRMLDMGFIHDVRRVIAALPKRRQTLLFSATMPPVIEELANSILIDPAYVEVTPQATTVERIDQSVFFVSRKDKRALLVHLLKDSRIRRVLVFTRTKHGANKLVEQLDRDSIRADAIHGNKSQSARERALLNFRQGRTRVLVATDIAARGLDIADVTHVINFDLPNEPESYVHRIGRTARAGASGVAYSFCDSEERVFLRDIEKLIRLRVPVVADHPYPALSSAAPTHDAPTRNHAPTPSNGSGARRSRRRRPSRRRDALPSGASPRRN
ncbi:MAG: DEAD/DEAH box helicase [Chloroflexi bacterium]|nr:ATP-dependent helicase [Chloroflexota bacterium]MBV6435642.1 ATP-dependent RNA helicase RhlE [Anaerolineae bacterium]MDL1915708.1 DEAD/DEAH box helicase [Anaerolineae bacterium CFX4]MBW7878242.1 DEAD/DEAH box helicase [Anaerolineae bacterium]MCC6566812.1 DEAD/DEAH box helicase [Chloroflexota bacterium]